MRDLGVTPGSGRSPGGGHGNPLQYCCLEHPHGQRSLTGYSPWGPKESDTTEQLSRAQKSKNKGNKNTKNLKEIRIEYVVEGKYPNLKGIPKRLFRVTYPSSDLPQLSCHMANEQERKKTCQSSGL